MDADEVRPRRRKDDEQTLRQSAKRYLQALEQDDLYMAGNYFHEMFLTMWRYEGPSEFATKLAAIEQDLRRRLRDTIGNREHLHQRILEDFSTNFDVCKLKHLPKEFETRGKREGLERLLEDEE